MSESMKRASLEAGLVPGDLLMDRYRIAEVIASGGMGTIYRAHDARLERDVCVKMFFDSSGNAESRDSASYEYFVQEIFALSQLQHPNTLNIYDYGFADGSASRFPFYVCELMDRGTLRQRIARGGKLSPAAALQILQPITGALSEAHARKIIHRDIKPTNILFGKAGQQDIVKLADFGIAKVTSKLPNRAPQTNGQYRLYTPGWSAPEQLQGVELDTRADVFGMGLLLAYMLIGKSLYPETSVPEALACYDEGDVFVERSLRQAKIPVPLADVIRRACRREPSERYATVDALLAATTMAVEALSGGQPQAAAKVDEAVHSTALRVDFSRPTFQHGDLQIALLRLRQSQGIEIAEAAKSTARIKATLVHSDASGPRVHLKGMNCFIAPQGGRPSLGHELHDDEIVEVLAATRQRLDRMRCSFGKLSQGHRLYTISGVALLVPKQACRASALLDFGPGRQHVLLYESHEGTTP